MATAESLHHNVFGAIVYSADECGWTGSCPLPVFAEYGKEGPDLQLLSDATPEFRKGAFALTIQDETAFEPNEQQCNAFRFLREHEAEVCQTVMSEVLKVKRDFGGNWVAWLRARRQTRVWGWLAALLGPEYKTLEDLKPAVRCIGLEISRHHFGTLAHVAFYFETGFGIETEHGFSVIYHPEAGTISGDASAIHELLP